MKSEVLQTITEEQAQKINDLKENKFELGRRNKSQHKTLERIRRWPERKSLEGSEENTKKLSLIEERSWRRKREGKRDRRLKEREIYW